MRIFRAVSGLATVLTIVLTACGGTAPPPAGAANPTPPGSAAAASEKVLNVYNWSDYIDPTVIPAFEKEYGIKVNYDVFDSNEVVETKLLTGHTGYDIVVPSASFLERQIKAGVYRKLDKSRLTNLKNLDPVINERVARHDPGNEHAVNYLWGTDGVGYNEARIRAALPDAPVDSLRMFYDPAVIAHFKDCGVTILDAPDEVVATVLVFLGRDANSESPEDLKAAEAVLLAIRPFVRYINSSKYIDDLANGEICLALGWSGDVLQARDRAAEAGKGITIGYHAPKEGAVMFFDMVAIPADAPHPQNAELFIDYLLRPDVAARNANFVRFATGNAAALPLIRADLRNDPDIYPTAQVLARWSQNASHSPEYTRLLTRTWTRFKTGK